MCDRAINVHIIGELKDGPWGGGNQFLKGLRAYLRSKGQYSEQPDQADVLLVNGHQWLRTIFQVYRLKKQRPTLRVIHRVDGPMEVVRGNRENYFLDRAIISFNDYFADATVFQSKWSETQCYLVGMSTSKLSSVILNASDPAIFHKLMARHRLVGKVRIVSTSWSSNARKGFDVIRFLDTHLDFSKYEFTFIGNSPIPFKNLRHIEPVSSQALAEELRRNDVFLQTSHIEACSNALIEAMTCGLIPVARNNSSHPEILGCCGVLYEGIDDVIGAIDSAVEKGVKHLDDRLKTLAMPHVGDAYLALASQSLASSSFTTSPFLLLKAWVWRVIAERPRLFLLLKRVFID